MIQGGRPPPRPARGRPRAPGQAGAPSLNRQLVADHLSFSLRRGRRPPGRSRPSGPGNPGPRCGCRRGSRPPPAGVPLGPCPSSAQSSASAPRPSADPPGPAGRRARACSGHPDPVRPQVGGGPPVGREGHRSRHRPATVRRGDVAASPAESPRPPRPAPQPTPGAGSPACPPPSAACRPETAPAHAVRGQIDDVARSLPPRPVVVPGPQGDPGAVGRRPASLISGGRRSTARPRPSPGPPAPGTAGRPRSRCQGIAGHRQPALGGDHRPQVQVQAVRRLLHRDPPAAPDLVHPDRLAARFQRQRPVTRLPASTGWSNSSCSRSGPAGRIASFTSRGIRRRPRPGS